MPEPGILSNSKSRTPGKRCSRQTICVVIVVLLVLSLIAVGLALGIPALIKKSKSDEKDFGDGTIPRAVSGLLRNADLSQDPCNNFYEYACGNYSRNAVIPPTEYQIGAPIEIKLKINSQLLDLISEPKDPKEPETFNKIKDFYIACMDIDRIEHVDNEPLKQLLKRLGDWPVVAGPSWQQIYNNWIELNSALYKAKVIPNQILDVIVQTNILQPDKNILYLLQPAKLGLPKELFLPHVSSLLTSYLELMVKVAQHFGADADIAKEDMRAALEFEVELAKLAVSSRQEGFQIVTIEMLQRTAPDTYYWLDFFHTMLPYTITAQEPIMINQPAYLKKLSTFMHNADIRTMTNYILWRIVLVNLQYLNEQTKKFQDDFLEQNSGLPVENRQSKCIRETHQDIQNGVSLMYASRYANQAVKESVTELSSAIEEEFREEVQKMSWMDNSTKSIAKSKLNDLKCHVSYPDDYSDSKTIDEYYKLLIITNNTYFENILTVKYWKYERNMWELRKTTTPNDNVLSDITEVSADYTLAGNNIQISLAFLQNSYFDEEGPLVFNLGAIGSVIGHEFFHSIDKKGGQYNKMGRKDNWWSRDSTTNFISASDCFIKKYDGYTDPISQINLNGTITAAENLADYVGVKVSYQVHKNTKQESEKQLEKLPNKFPWTTDQLFWLSYASMYCAKYRENQGTVPLNTNVNHSPEVFRVNGPLSSLPEFLTDFKCSDQSAMAKSSKCTL